MHLTATNLNKIILLIANITYIILPIMWSTNSSGLNLADYKTLHWIAAVTRTRCWPCEI